MHDINAEELLLYHPQGQLKVAVKGLHKRNTYRDIIDIQEQPDGSHTLELARASLYNVLPEVMFHPTDRFDNLPQYDEKEQFEQQLEQQQLETDNARLFFEPLDLLLLKLRCDLRQQAHPLTADNHVLINLLADRLTPQQHENPFIQSTLTFLPHCKYIRGNKTLLTLMLRKVLGQETLHIEPHALTLTFTDNSPRYDCETEGVLGNCFVDNQFQQPITVYDVHFWSENDCDDRFHSFVNRLETYRLFVQDYFMAVDDLLRFNLVNDEDPLTLNDDLAYNYLNYNANI